MSSRAEERREPAPRPDNRPPKINSPQRRRAAGIYVAKHYATGRKRSQCAAGRARRASSKIQQVLRAIDLTHCALKRARVSCFSPSLQQLAEIREPRARGKPTPPPSRFPEWKLYFIFLCLRRAWHLLLFIVERWMLCFYRMRDLVRVYTVLAWD